MKFQFEWANGSEIVEGKTMIDACHHIKTSPENIVTGWLVRIRPVDYVTPEQRKKIKWGYWDAEQFWKHLKKVAKNG